MNGRYVVAWQYKGDYGPMWAMPLYLSDVDYVELGEFSYATGPDQTAADGRPMAATATAKERRAEVREQLRRFVEHRIGDPGPSDELLDAIAAEPASDTMPGQRLGSSAGSISVTRLDQLIAEHPIRQGALF